MLAPAQARTALAAMRLVIGLLGLLAPRRGSRLFGLDPDANPALPYLARLFAVRDAALGWGQLTADPRDVPRWLRLGLACDSGDVAAALAARRAGELSRRSGTLAAGAALVAVGLGVLASRPDGQG